MLDRDRDHVQADDERMLADFQEALLDLLSLGLAPEEVQRCLLADGRFQSLGTYIVAMEPRAIEIATELTAKWARSTG